MAISRADLGSDGFRAGIDVRVSFRDDAGSDDSAFDGPASFHPGGAHVLFCDGSVRFIKSTVNRTGVWWALPRPGGSGWR